MNTDPQKTSSSIEKQRGVILPLTAVIILAMLGAAVFLGLDSMYVKKEQQRLKAAVEAVCKRVTPHALIQRRAFLEFSEQIRDLTNGSSPYLQNTKIISAKLLIPTMPSNGSFTRFKRSDYQSAVSPTIPSEADLVEFKQICPVCSFASDISTPATKIDFDNPEEGNQNPMLAFSLFPFDTVANNNNLTGSTDGSYAYNAGMNVGCEVIGEVTSPFTFFVGGTTNDNESKTRAKIKTMWWLPVRGLLKPAPGLSIGIAPEMNTSVNWERFRFVSRTSGSGIEGEGGGSPPSPSMTVYTNTFQDKYDPLKRVMTSDKRNNYFHTNISQSSSFSSNYSSGSNSSEPAIAGYELGISEGHSESSQQSLSEGNQQSLISGPTSNYSESYASPEPMEEMIYDFVPEMGANGVPRDPPCTSSSCPELPDSGVVSGSLLEEALTSCVNPASLVRNLIVSTIVELSSRHGQLRDATEVSIINPTASSSTIPVAPTIVSQFGEDIAEKRYQIPFVLSSQVFSGNNSPLWSDPFGQTTEASTANEIVSIEHRKMFSKQLRMCFHLYDQPPTGSNFVSALGAIMRYQEDRLQDALYNQGFEPSIYETTLYSPLKTSPYESGATPEPWDQPDPWSGENAFTLTAGQIVAALGTIQMCPVPSSCPASQCGVEKNICTKPSADSALTPDLVSYFNFLQRNPLSASDSASAAATEGTQPDTYPGIRKPGVVPLLDDSDGTTLYPLPIEEYRTTFNNRSHVLLVLHTLPSSIQLEKLRNFVTEMSTGIRFENGIPSEDPPVRPVTVIYIPTTSDGASTSSIARLQLALTPHQTSTTGMALPLKVEPSLFVVAPKKETAGAFSDTDFQLYWKKMLTDNDEGAIALAESIFYGRILRTELKY